MQFSTSFSIAFFWISCSQEGLIERRTDGGGWMKADTVVMRSRRLSYDATRDVRICHVPPVSVQNNSLDGEYSSSSSSSASRLPANIDNHRSSFSCQNYFKRSEDGPKINIMRSSNKRLSAPTA